MTRAFAVHVVVDPVDDLTHLADEIESILVANGISVERVETFDREGLSIDESTLPPGY